jgi:hypothetical protein
MLLKTIYIMNFDFIAQKGGIPREELVRLLYIQLLEIKNWLISVIEHRSLLISMAMWRYYNARSQVYQDRANS